MGFECDWDLGEPHMRIAYCGLLTGLSLVYSHKPYTLNCSRRRLVQRRRKYVHDDKYKDEDKDWDVDQDENEDKDED